MYIISINSNFFQDFVKSQYLQYKATDDSTILMDPEKTSYWFSLGPRSLVECDQMMLLQSIGKVSLIYLTLTTKKHSFWSLHVEK